LYDKGSGSNSGKGLADFIGSYSPLKGAVDLVLGIAESNVNPDFLEKQKRENSASTAYLLERSETIFRLAQVVGASDPEIASFFQNLTESGIPESGIQGLLSAGSWGKSRAELQSVPSNTVVLNPDPQTADRLIKEVGDLRKAVLDFQEKQKQGALTAVQAAAERKSLEQRIRDMRAVSYALHGLTLLTSNPNLKKTLSEIVEVVNYAAEVTEIVMNFAEMGTLAATGNILGATFKLISFFGNLGPTPEAIILQEIQGLKEMIAAMHDNMLSSLLKNPKI
jgi:hypothetical protein